MIMFVFNMITFVWYDYVVYGMITFIFNMIMFVFNMITFVWYDYVVYSMITFVFNMITLYTV